jgi:hypothetical protein
MDSAMAADVDTASIFEVTDVCDIIFGVEGTITAGSLQIKYSPNYSPAGTGDWYDLDTTNLAFTTAGQRTIKWGNCHIKGTTTGWTVTGSDDKIWIGGQFVHEVE